MHITGDAWHPHQRVHVASESASEFASEIASESASEIARRSHLLRWPRVSHRGATEIASEPALRVHWAHTEIALSAH